MWFVTKLRLEPNGYGRMLYTNIYIYIYIYTERERERKIYVGIGGGEQLKDIGMSKRLYFVAAQSDCTVPILFGLPTGRNAMPNGVGNKRRRARLDRASFWLDYQPEGTQRRVARYTWGTKTRSTS